MVRIREDENGIQSKRQGIRYTRNAADSIQKSKDTQKCIDQNMNLIMTLKMYLNLRYDMINELSLIFVYYMSSISGQIFPQSQQQITKTKAKKKKNNKSKSHALRNNINKQQRITSPCLRLIMVHFILSHART